MKRVYIDGVFDLFHKGHLESFIKAKNIFNDPDNTYLIVGVVSDYDCSNYKRKPVINEKDRVDIIKNIKCVNEVIFPCSMSTTLQFVKDNNIDIVVHGFSDENDKINQYKYFKEVIDSGHFKEIEYYSQSSTSKIIKKIKSEY